MNVPCAVFASLQVVALQSSFAQCFAAEYVLVSKSPGSRLRIAQHDVGAATILRAQDDCGHISAKRCGVVDDIIRCLQLFQPERHRFFTDQ